MSGLRVACVVEGDYLPHVAAMVHSVLTHGGSDVHVHLLHGPEFPAPPLQRFERWVRDAGARVAAHEVPDAWTEALPTEGFTRKATWYRIFLGDLLAEEDRVLFLDADVVVLDDLGPLWKTDLEGHLLGAVTNVFEPHWAHRPVEIGLASAHDYFNAGVLLMDLAALRRDDAARRLYEYGVAHAPDLAFRDQDALNAVLAGSRLPLDPRWNAMNILRFEDWSIPVFGAEAVARARSNPAIRHFEGPDDNKPWHRGCDRDDHERYLEHRRRTPWPRVRMEGPRLLRLRRRAAQARDRLRAARGPSRSG